MKTSIYNLDQYPLSDRNGSYGGNSGDKEGIFINNDYWIVKYPDSTKGLSNVGSLQFTSSPLSEYIGSHIYNILGYDVHDTVLGIRNDTLVVACKDFCDDTHNLYEFRQLKNAYGRELNKQLETTFKTTGSDHFTDLRAIIAHLKVNPTMVNMPELKTRFWDCVVIDGLINNNDRNNSNWGILSSKTDRQIAPVFDNGSAFSPKISESKIRNKLANEQALISGVLNTTTSYTIDGEHSLYFRDLLKLNIPDLKEAVLRTVPNIEQHISECKEFIREIPEKCGKYDIISKDRKEVYCKELDLRLEKILMPALEQTKEEQTKQVPEQQQGYELSSLDDEIESALAEQDNNHCKLGQSKDVFDRDEDEIR